MYRRRIVAALAAVLCLTAGFLRRPVRAAELIPNRAETVASIRDGLKGHAKTITVSFSSARDVWELLFDEAGDWMEDALSETDAADEGDYLRYQCGGYSVNRSRVEDGGRWRYTVVFTPDYYSYLAQEEEVTEKLSDIFRDFAFSDTASEYERARAIYAYLCENVRYDKVHRKNPYYHLKSTAYAALIQGSATCQGYCTALYRMYRAAGLECRIVTGQADGEYHAWNIARVDGRWYCLDATWDAGQDTWTWFLRGADNFPRHVPDGDLLDADALSASDYAPPLSTVDYAPP